MRKAGDVCFAQVFRDGDGRPFTTITICCFWINF